MLRVVTVVLLTLLCIPVTSRAGLYYSGETYAELPSQWRGFLLDQRLLRILSVKPSGAGPVNPERTRYEQAAAALEKIATERALTADESADLGALHVRLGQPGKAVEVLRAAQSKHPLDFHIAANLGTAWQLQGDLEQAAESLKQAVRLSPGKLQKVEEYHLKLVQGRLRQARDAQELDDLFGVRYVGEHDKYEPGKLAAGEREKLPSEAVAIVQQLALWLPADARLLWQLAELAGAQGDVKTAAAMMDGCVSEFGLRAPELRAHRQAMRAAADELAARSADDAKATHEGHASLFKPRSSRPLVTSLDVANLPPINADGVTALPWSVVTLTALDKQFRPTFAKYLRELDGKQVALSGFMQPLGEDFDMGSFMLIEYPVGCWYCEMPDITGIILVELPSGKTAHLTRSLVKVVGVLKLNNNDPENFLYTVTKAKVTVAD
jgi:tetratricopeptide (TPR) repeat protein